MKRPIPQRFNTVIQVFTDEGVVSVEYIPPSGQFWNSLGDTDKDELKGFMRENKQDPESLLAVMRAMLPTSNPVGR